MKTSKIHLSLVALVLLASLHSARLSAQSSFLRGDTNQDGRVDLSDAQTLFGFLFLGGGESVPECEDAADANDDGALDLTDGVRILNFLFLGELAPAAPGVAECGVDPTEDSLGCHSFATCSALERRLPETTEAVSRRTRQRLQIPQVEAASEIRSVESSVAVNVTFRNNTAGYVEVLWVDYEGNEQPYGGLEAGAEYTQPTFATHPWLFKQAGEVIGTYVATDKASQYFAVGKEAEAPELRSVESSVAVNVTFQNNSLGEVELFWVDYEGNPQRYAVLAGGQRYTQGTFATHPWQLVQGGQVIGTYVATSEASQEFAVGSYYPIEIEVTVTPAPEPTVPENTDLPSLFDFAAQQGASPGLAVAQR